MKIRLTSFFCFLICSYVFLPCLSQNQQIDAQVKAFFESKKGEWDDWNVPEKDGQLLYDIIVENNYQHALEIGTSTGYSSIWIAWALSKTGGQLTTIEINESRYEEALANFKAAGVGDYIDARLADAHELVPKLKGPFDFVFSDADKGWYKNYFISIDPKLKAGGCFAAHNISPNGGMAPDFYNHIKSLPNYETTVNTQGGGMSISFKKKN